MLKKVQPELEAIVKGYIWWNTIKKNGATIGQSILDLCYYNSHGLLNTRQLTRIQIYGLSLCNIIYPWIKRRLFVMTNLRTTKNAIEQIETIYNIMNLANSLLFLYHGNYRTIYERMLRLKCGSTSPDQQQHYQIELEFMKRELLWHAFAEFLAFILPLINFYKLKNSIRNLLKTYLWKKEANETIAIANQRELDDLKRCAICNNWPVNAHEIGCKHVFCYYCLFSNFLSDENNGFKCTICLFHVNDLNGISKVKLDKFIRNNVGF